MRTPVLRVAVAALGLLLITPLAHAETASPVPDLSASASPTTTASTTPTTAASPTPTVTASASPTKSASPTPTPTPTPSPTPSPTPTVSAAPLTAAQKLYVTPGYHYVNGRYWKTRCEMYSTTTVRCFTDIYATVIKSVNGVWYKQNTWTFNNLTYLPSPEAAWKGNNLVSGGVFYSGGRTWKSECNTAATGYGACRVYIWASAPSLSDGVVKQVWSWRFNGFVNFSTPTRPAVTRIPATAPTPSGVPSPGPLQPIVYNALVQKGFRLDSRCLTGRGFCVSKDQRKMAWVVNGKVDVVLDVRFGSELTPTRNGAFTIGWKSRDHVSSLYHTAMPYAMFFSGGQAIHYSADFAANGYNGASHGCVNVRDRAAIARLFDLARVGDKVIVYN